MKTPENPRYTREGNKRRLKELLWRLFAFGLLASQLAGCEPTVASPSDQTPYPPIVEPYISQPTLPETPTPTPTETPTPEVSSFILSPTTLTKEKAEGFISEAKQWSEEELQERLRGRVFVDEKTGAFFVLSQDAYSSFLSQINSENPQPNTTQEIIYRLENSWWLKRLAYYGDYQQLKADKQEKNYTKLRKGDIVLINKDYSTIFINKENLGPWSELVLTTITEEGFSKIGVNDRWQENELLRNRIINVWWSEEEGRLFADDGYHKSAFFEINENGEGNWRLVLPHERRSGQYEILTPSQRMIKAMNDLKPFTGYDAGDWQGKDEDFSPYTFTYEGKKYTIDVSPVKNDEGEIVYEVVRDPKTKEMMLTVIKSTDTQITTAQEITSIPQEDIEALRQTWAILLAADPEIMQKFWRVNKVVGLAANSKMKDEWSLASTGTGIGNGNAFVNIYNPNIAPWIGNDPGEKNAFLNRFCFRRKLCKVCSRTVSYYS